MPKAQRDRLALLPRMQKCARASEGGCSGTLTWQHCYGRKNAPDWTVICLCWRMHLGDLQNKQKDKWIALHIATDADLERDPKRAPAWKQERLYLDTIYGEAGNTSL